MSFYILDILYAECKNDRYFRSSTHRRKTSLKLTCANLLSKKIFKSILSSVCNITKVEDSQKYLKS